MISVLMNYIITIYYIYNINISHISRGPMRKPLGGSKVGFHPSEVDKMSTRNFW